MDESRAVHREREEGLRQVDRSIEANAGPLRSEIGSGSSWRRFGPTGGVVVFDNSIDGKVPSAVLLRRQEETLGGGATALRVGKRVAVCGCPWPPVSQPDMLEKLSAGVRRDERLDSLSRGWYGTAKSGTQQDVCLW